MLLILIDDALAYRIVMVDLSIYQYWINHRLGLDMDMDWI